MVETKARQLTVEQGYALMSIQFELGCMGTKGVCIDVFKWNCECFAALCKEHPEFGLSVVQHLKQEME